jgi:hypothetical protein
MSNPLKRVLDFDEVGDISFIFDISSDPRWPYQRDTWQNLGSTPNASWQSQYHALSYINSGRYGRKA